MASASCCSVCPKGAGTCYCPGCNAYFCNRDFRNHREMLVHKLDELTVDRNELQEKINKTNSQKHSSSSLLLQIDTWQEETIQKVKQAAEQARQQALEMLNSKQEEMTRQFQTLSQEMGQLRETEDVLEQDLSRLKNQIEQLHKGLENVSQPPTIELNTKQSEQIMWDRMIHVQDRSALSSQEQKPLAFDAFHTTIQSTSNQRIILLLETRLEAYRKAIENARAIGAGAKARQNQPQYNLIQELLQTARTGRPIDENEIPPAIYIAGELLG